MLNNPIPLIDLSGPSTPEELAREISEAVRTVGFLHVRGIGVTTQEVQRIFDISKALYASPLSDRACCAEHVAFGVSRLSESAGAGDLKENFSFGRFSPPFSETQQELPKVLEENKAEMLAFQRKCFDATCKLLDAFSVALNFPVDFFRQRHNLGGCAVTLINYPSIEPNGAVKTSATVDRASAHKDWGSVTLLFQEENGTPGLEIFLPTSDSATEGTWFPAPIIPDTVLVNVGLALEKWTGGQFTATLHRVVTQTAPDGSFSGRRSIAYFVQPSDEVVFNPIERDGTIVKTEGALTSREFFLERMNSILVAVK